MKTEKRYKLLLRNKTNGEIRPALAKSADMLSAREANFWIRHAKGRMTEPWEYIKEQTNK